MTSNYNSVRVGELLVDAQIISSSEMTEAIQVSKRLGVPIGRVLMMSGSVRQDELAGSLQVQPLIREGQIPYAAAISALRRVHQLRISIADAFAQEDLRPDLDDNPEYLGELLLDSNLVAPEDMERAIQTSMSSGIPLGSALVLQGILSPALFPSLQRIQKQLIEGALTREEGIKEVQDTFVLWLKAEESKEKVAAPLHGKDTIAAEDTYLTAKSEPIRGNGSPANAYGHHVEAKTEPLETKVASVKPTEAVADVRLVDLLKSAGVFSQADVQRNYEAMLKDPIRSGRFYVELGLIDEEDMKRALRSHALMTRGSLTKEEAIFALNSSRTTEFEKQISGTDSVKVQRYMDKQWRGKATKVIGGALFGALVAGLTFSNRKK
ncbi:MAG: hypothetical protein Q8T09_12750 [Candidatus Melainabacteria bacterium]|nr:hypothetical protein [Candidatus Melainabacteria bacterium]